MCSKGKCCSMASIRRTPRIQVQGRLIVSQNIRIRMHTDDNAIYAMPAGADSDAKHADANSIHLVSSSIRFNSVCNCSRLPYMLTARAPCKKSLRRLFTSWMRANQAGESQHRPTVPRCAVRSHPYRTNSEPSAKLPEDGTGQDIFSGVFS
jgi:hypothetical protein